MAQTREIDEIQNLDKPLAWNLMNSFENVSPLQLYQLCGIRPQSQKETHVIENNIVMQSGFFMLCPGLLESALRSMKTEKR